MTQKTTTSRDDYFEKKLWKKKNPRKGNVPLPGALAVVGKDFQGNGIILPTGYFENTHGKLKQGKKIRLRFNTAKQAKEIVGEYMGHVNAKLALYQHKSK